jgi:rRNA processing protein Gar1
LLKYLSGIVDDTFEPVEAPYFTEKLNSTSFDKSMYQRLFRQIV